MTIQNGALASPGSFGLEKVSALFYVTHPKVDKPLLGPFLTEADAECGRVVMRSPDAVVTASSVKSPDRITYWRALNNGNVCRLFAGKELN